MQVSYLDPLDDNIIWYSPHTLVLGMTKDEDRQSMTAFFQCYHSDVFDLYRDAEQLVPRMLDFPCFLRVIDYETYRKIEPALIDYLKDEDPLNLTATVVYGAGKNDLIDSIAVINGSMTHPTMLAGYYAFLIRNRQ